MTIMDIVREYLVAHGYDGLCHIETECGCGLEDLFICGNFFSPDCEAAHRVKIMIDGNAEDWFVPGRRITCERCLSGIGHDNQVNME